MKDKKIWYLGYLISLVALILAFVFKENRTFLIIDLFVACLSFSISYVNIIHNKMMEKDREYRIMVNDERTEKIRDKVNATMCIVLMFMNLIVAVTALIFKEHISAILLVSSTCLAPLIMLGFSKYFERKY